jgi:hypothetical protein
MAGLLPEASWAVNRGYFMRLSRNMVCVDVISKLANIECLKGAKNAPNLCKPEKDSVRLKHASPSRKGKGMEATLMHGRLR